MKGGKHNDPNFQSAINLGKRCYEQVIDNERSGEIDVEPSKSKYKKPGGGRNITIPDVWQELFEWFVDVDGTLRAQL